MVKFKKEKENNLISKKYLIAIIVIIVIAMLTICGTIYARYTINKSQPITISSEPFYINAEADSSIQFYDGATANLTVKNNNGTQYNSMTATYEIKIEGNSKFTFSVDGETATNNVITKTIEGGAIKENNFAIKFMADINSLEPTENVTLKVAATGPYSGEIDLPITISLKPMTVTLNANGGSVNPSTIVVYKGQKYSSLPTPTRTGHTFNGWYSAATGGTKYTTSTEVTSDASTQTLYAQWTSRLLADKVSVGDYVNYGISYSNVATNADGGYKASNSYTGWRVLSVEGSGDSKYVRLVTAGIPLTYVHLEATGAGAKSATALTTNFFSTAINSTSTSYTFRRCGFSATSISALKTLFANNTHTQVTSGTPKVQAMTKADLDKAWKAITGATSNTGNGTYVTSTDMLAIPAASETGEYAAYHLATACEDKYLWNVRYLGAVVYTRNEHGIRPVVTLKTTVETTGKTNNVWQLK